MSRYYSDVIASMTARQQMSRHRAEQKEQQWKDTEDEEDGDGDEEKEAARRTDRK